MGVIDGIKNFFGNNTETMQTGEDERSATLALGNMLNNVLKGLPQIDNPFDDFVYPYSPMQRSKRFPKIINAYALQARANADIRALKSHENSLTDLFNRTDDLLSRLTTLELTVGARVFTETAISARQTLSTDRTHSMSASVETAGNVILVGMQAIYAYRVGEGNDTSGAITIRDGWNYTKTQLAGGIVRHTFTVNVQNVYSGGQTSFELVVKPVFYQTA